MMSVMSITRKTGRERMLVKPGRVTRRVDYNTEGMGGDMEGRGGYSDGRGNG